MQLRLRSRSCSKEEMTDPLNPTVFLVFMVIVKINPSLFYADCDVIKNRDRDLLFGCKLEWYI